MKPFALALAVTLLGSAGSGAQERGGAVATVKFDTLTALAEERGDVLPDSMEGVKWLKPSDDAIAALPVGTYQALVKPENASKLNEFIAYHRVPLGADTPLLKSGETVALVQGSDGSTRLAFGDPNVRSAVVVGMQPAVDGLSAAILDKALVPTKISEGVDIGTSGMIVDYFQAAK